MWQTVMQTEPKVSVIIPTKNPGPVFRKVLREVLGQITSFPFEVIVIDSGSCDGTLDHVRSLTGVSLIEIEPGSFGHGRTRNLAISRSRGEYVAMLTHDALPATRDWLTQLVAAAEADARIAGVFGRHLAYASASPFTKRELEQHFEGFRSRAVVWLDDLERYRRESGYRQFLHFFSDNNALLRRSVWERIPYPDVDFAEDQLWAQQIIEAGHRKAYSHEAAVYHSHNYGLVERLQRSFDESLAFKRFFGYRLCRSFSALVRSWLMLSRRDLRFARHEGLWSREPAAVLRQPLDHLMRVAGYYLGTHGDRFPEAVQLLLSRDRKLKATNAAAARE